MNGLIKREDAINAMSELQGIAQSKAELTGISKAWKRIKKLPTVDAMQVVRCKECIEYRESVGACHYFNYEPTDEMDFCSHGIRVDGERKDGEHGDLRNDE